MASKSSSRPANIREKGQLMSPSEIERTLIRLAHEIIERNNGVKDLGFVGVRRRGVPLAQRIARKIEALEKRSVPVGILDINLYRDDLTTVDIKPVVNATEIPFSVQGKDIILMDDVLYTGRTVRAALDALFDHGRPARVQPEPAKLHGSERREIARRRRDVQAVGPLRADLPDDRLLEPPCDLRLDQLPAEGAEQRVRDGRRPQLAHAL